MIEINKEQLLKLKDKEKARILKYIVLGLVKYVGNDNEISKINR